MQTQPVTSDVIAPEPKRFYYWVWASDIRDYSLESVWANDAAEARQKAEMACLGTRDRFREMDNA